MQSTNQEKAAERSVKGFLQNSDAGLEPLCESLQVPAVAVPRNKALLPEQLLPLGVIIWSLENAIITFKKLVNLVLNDEQVLFHERSRQWKLLLECVIRTTRDLDDVTEILEKKISQELDTSVGNVNYCMQLLGYLRYRAKKWTFDRVIYKNTFTLYAQSGITTNNTQAYRWGGIKFMLGMTEDWSQLLTECPEYADAVIKSMEDERDPRNLYHVFQIYSKLINLTTIQTQDNEFDIQRRIAEVLVGYVPVRFVGIEGNISETQLRDEFRKVINELKPMRIKFLLACCEILADFSQVEIEFVEDILNLVDLDKFEGDLFLFQPQVDAIADLIIQILLLIVGNLIETQDLTSDSKPQVGGKLILINKIGKFCGQLIGWIELNDAHKIGHMVKALGSWISLVVGQLKTSNDRVQDCLMVLLYSIAITSRIGLCGIIIVADDLYSVEKIELTRRITTWLSNDQKTFLRRKPVIESSLNEWLKTKDTTSLLLSTVEENFINRVKILVRKMSERLEGEYDPNSLWILLNLIQFIPQSDLLKEIHFAMGLDLTISGNWIFNIFDALNESKGIESAKICKQIATFLTSKIDAILVAADSCSDWTRLLIFLEWLTVNTSNLTHLPQQLAVFLQRCLFCEFLSGYESKIIDSNSHNGSKIDDQIFGEAVFLLISQIAPLCQTQFNLPLIQTPSILIAETILRHPKLFVPAFDEPGAGAFAQVANSCVREQICHGWDDLWVWHFDCALASVTDTLNDGQAGLCLMIATPPNDICLSVPSQAHAEAYRWFKGQKFVNSPEKILNQCAFDPIQLQASFAVQIYSQNFSSFLSQNHINGPYGELSAFLKRQLLDTTTLELFFAKMDATTRECNNYGDLFAALSFQQLVQLIEDVNFLHKFVQTDMLGHYLNILNAAKSGQVLGCGLRIIYDLAKHNPSPTNRLKTIKEIDNLTLSDDIAITTMAFVVRERWSHLLISKAST